MNTLFICELDIYSVIGRLLAAVILGGAIGWEREVTGHPAGLRTYMFVALGATVAMMLNQYLDALQTQVWSAQIPVVSRTDVSRLGAQVISGIGFLGAGTILVTHRQEIKGITTAAGLWSSACMGIAIGAGFIDCAFYAVLWILLCMSVFSRVEGNIMSNARNMNIFVQLEHPDEIGQVLADIRSVGYRVFSVDNARSSGDENHGFIVSMYLPRRQPHDEVMVGLSAIAGIRSISEV